MIKFASLRRGGSVRIRPPRASAPFWVLCALLTACFVLGGSARGDVASLILLRPLAVLALGFGLWRLSVRQIRDHRFMLAMALAVLALPALQLIPLPPAVWQHLPGRGLIMDIDRVAGIGLVWRPLSLTPAATWNALFAVIVPVAVLVLGIQLAAEERRRLLPVVLILCGCSALLGLMQILGDPNGPLYFYRITNNGAAVGLFANRNHQALLLALMLPMLAILARKPGAGGGARQLAALIAGLVLLPLVLITGSRSGLLAAAAALLAIPFILGRDGAGRGTATARAGRRSTMLPLAGKAGLIFAGIGLIVLTIWFGRDLAWARLLASEPADEIRSQIVPTIVSMILAYAPAGSGMGSFERVFQVHEPDALLNPTYMNHAHNDWLEVLLTGGAAAGFMLVFALAALAVQAKQAFFAGVGFAPGARMARLGLVLLLLAGLASLFDYPLRVPSLAALFAVAAVWAGCSLSKNQPMNVAG